jgi:hypothetical protein
VGAAYFTVDDTRFGEVVGDWVDRGLVRPWTDTFHIADGTQILGTKSGPVRYAAPRGAYRDNLRRFVREAREGGATPILATPVVRRRWSAGSGPGCPDASCVVTLRRAS